MNHRLLLTRLTSKGVARNGLLSLLQAACGIASYFIVMRLVVQAMGLEGVGLWALTMGFVSLVKIADVAGASGLARMVAMHVDQGNLQATHIDTLVVVVFSFFMILCGISYYPLHGFITSSVDAKYFDLSGSLLIWALICTPISMTSIAHLSAIDGIGRADARSLINIVGYIFYIGATLLLIKEFGILALVYSQVAQNILNLISARIFLYQNLSSLALFPSHFSSRAARDGIHYGIRLQASSVPLMLFDALNRIFVGRWAGLDILAIYDLGYKVSLYTRAIVQAALNPLVPEFTKKYFQDKSIAIKYHAAISGSLIPYISLAFIFSIALLPLLGWFVIGAPSTQLVYWGSIFCLTWGIVTVGLSTQLYARSAGVLKWAMLGQVILNILGLPIVYITSRSEVVHLLPWAISLPILVGYVFAFSREVVHLGLTPLGPGSCWRPVVWINLFLGTATVAILISASDLHVFATFSGGVGTQ